MSEKPPAKRNLPNEDAAEESAKSCKASDQRHDTPSDHSLHDVNNDDLDEEISGLAGDDAMEGPDISFSLDEESLRPIALTDHANWSRPDTPPDHSNAVSSWEGFINRTVLRHAAQIDELQQQVQDLQGRNAAPLTNNDAELESILRHMMKQNMELEAKIEASKKAAQESESMRATNLRESRSQLEREVKSLAVDNANLTSEIDAYKTEILEVKALLSAREGEIARVKAELAAISQRGSEGQPEGSARVD
ncbi:hypothetical protein FGRMN_8549 [Fusarium graminum]|nr:hypothetical protein FGRMN_8549 [Fusarium graminum]